MSTTPAPDTGSLAALAALAAGTAPRALTRIHGYRLLVLNWRDIRHPQAGGAETYAHEIARRWVAAGAEVTFLTSRPDGLPVHETIDGIEVLRAGNQLSVYHRTALRLLTNGFRYDAVIDCQNGIPFFAPLFVTNVPVIQVVHHVHQDQFATFFSPGPAALGRALEAKGTRWVYRGHRNVAVSASTRQEMRKRLGIEGIIDIVPNGGVAAPVHTGERAAVPTITLITRLVPHKRVDLLLRAIAAIRTDVPDLRVEIVGGGPLLEPLRANASELGLAEIVTLHGRLPDADRDRLLSTAWLTTSTSAGEGWGCSVLEAAAAGVPCTALRVTGIRDSVIDGRTGWLVEDTSAFAATLLTAITELRNPARAAAYAAECRRWAGRFTWDRSAELLAASVLSAVDGAEVPPRAKKRSRTDMTTLAWFTHLNPAFAVSRLRLTDEVHVVGTRIAAVMGGCDDIDALAKLERLGAQDVVVRTARTHEVLAGPDVADDPTNTDRIPAQESTA